MANQIPLVLVNGQVQQIPVGDTISSTIAPGAGSSPPLGIYPDMQVAVSSGPFTLGSVNTAQNVFPAACDTFTLEASSTYFFEAYYYLTTGTTTHTTATLFGGTATLTNILYDATLYSGAASTIVTSASMVEVTVKTAKVLNATSTAATTKIYLTGVIRSNAAGTLIPQIQFSAAPGGTNTTNTNSWFKIWKVGSSTIQSVGSIS